MSYINKKTLMAAILLSGFIYSGSSYATPVTCSSGSPHPEGLAVSDMTFDGSNADDCYGVVIGNSNSNGDNIWPGTDVWTLLAKENTPGVFEPEFGTVNGIKFTLDVSPDGGDTSGTWDLSWEKVGPPGYNLEIDFIGVLKAGNRFASYLFDDLLFSVNDSGTGAWAISYIKDNGQTSDLSHLSLYYKNPRHSVPPDEVPVPEPGMMGLLGMGLLGMGLSRIRRRRKAS